MQRQTIAPAQIELLRHCLHKSISVVKVYFEALDNTSPFADYVAEITPYSDSLYDYTIGGHGIGVNTRGHLSMDSTIEQVLQDNEKLNAGGLLTLEFS